jgi:hypothetical protein
MLVGDLAVDLQNSRHETSSWVTIDDGILVHDGVVL